MPESYVIGRFAMPSGEEATFTKYLQNPINPENLEKLAYKWETQEALRIVADIRKKQVYVFPYWLLHSSFLENELGLNYSLLMDSKDYFFGAVTKHPLGCPYAIVESSQTPYLIERFGSKEKMLDHFESNLAWLRKHCIDPTIALR